MLFHSGHLFRQLTWNTLLICLYARIQITAALFFIVLAVSLGLHISSTAFSTLMNFSITVITKLLLYMFQCLTKHGIEEKEWNAKPHLFKQIQISNERFETRGKKTKQRTNWTRSREMGDSLDKKSKIRITWTKRKNMNTIRSTKKNFKKPKFSTNC